MDELKEASLMYLGYKLSWCLEEDLNNYNNYFTCRQHLFFSFLLTVSDDATGPQFVFCGDQICLLDKDRPGVSKIDQSFDIIRRLKHASLFLINYRSAQHLISHHVCLISHINVTETPERWIYGLVILIESLRLSSIIIIALYVL